MQKLLLPLLRCPVTRTLLTIDVLKNSVKMFNGENVEIIGEAILYAGEDWFYPVINGIPRLHVEAFIDYEVFLKSSMPDYSIRKETLLHKYGALITYAAKKNKRTKQSFTKEWAVFDYDKDNTWDADDEGMIKRFLKETNETEESLKGKFIFDAGCGNGKLDSLIAKNCGAVVALDFANCIEQAYKKNEFKNVYFIEADVQFPPLIFNYFDIVHSSGVLIHTNNAELTFSCIEPAVKDNGKLSVWLYHPRKNFVHNAFNFIRRITSKLPLTFQFYLYLVTIFPISFCIKRLKGNKQNHREMMVDILDWLTPQFRSEHEHTEAATWFYKRGYKNVNVTTSGIFGFNIIGEK